ncbi:MAG: hypothetical protein V3R81_08385 [Gammaproteobacteria bacterium]
MARMGGQVLPSYTPSVTEGMKGVRGAMMGQQERQIENQKNELASAAWMGDPQAMQELAAMDPQMAAQVETTVGKRQARNRQTDLDQQADQDRTRKFATENKELLDEMSANIGMFDDYEMAAGYAADQISQLEGIMGPESIPDQFREPLTPEAFEQFKELRKVVTSGDWERSGPPVLEMGPDGKPRRVQTFINPKTLETQVVPASIGRALTQFDPEMAKRITGAKEEGKIEAQIDLADDKAISAMSAEAKVALMPARTRAKNTIGIIEQLRNHPGRKYATGIGWLNPGKYAPGTDAHNFMIMADQASGRVFAEAYETLKGGGQITEIESRKAEQAIARMETSQSQDEYLRALDEFEAATREGYKKLLDLASTTPEKFNQLMSGELSQPLPGSSAPGDMTMNNPALPQSKAEYDALPTGAYYMKDGKVKRKK